jgi:hypothetical protein
MCDMNNIKRLTTSDELSRYGLESILEPAPPAYATSES